MSDENPYLELANEIPDKNTQAVASDNPYMDLADKLDTLPDASLKGSTFVAAEKDPDHHAKVLTLSEKLGSRSDFIEENFDIVRKSNEKKLLDEQAMSSSPKLKSFIANPDNLAVSKDDLDTLNKLEKAHDQYGFWGQAFEGIKSSSISLMSSALKSPSYLMTALSNANYQGSKDMYDLTQKYIGDTGISALDKPPMTPDEVAKQTEWFRSNEATKYLDKKAQEIWSKQPLLNSSIETEFKAGNYSKAGKLIALQAIASSPTTLGLAVAGMTGYGEAGLVAAGLTSASSKFDESIGKPGVSAGQSAAVSTYYGGAEAIFEKLGTMSIIDNWSKALAKDFGKQSAKEVMFNVGKNIAANTFQEGSEEFLTSIAQDFADYSTGVNPDAMKGSIGRALEAGAIGGFTGGALGGAGVSIELKQRMFNKKQIEETQAFYNDLGEYSKESKLRMRSPEKFRELVERLTENGPVENTYINIEGFNQYFQKKEMNPTQVAQELGISEAYNKAIETGSDIMVPTAVMAEKLAPSEHYGALAEHIKFNPDGMTANEAATAEADLANNIKQEYENAKSNKTEDEVKTIEDSAKEVGKNIEQQLKDANYSPKAAKKQAALYEEFFKTQGMKSNQMPMDLFNKYGLRINNMQNELKTDGTVYNQEKQTLSKEEIISAANEESLVKNAERLKAEGYDIWTSQNPVFNNNGEEIDNIKMGLPGSEFSVKVQDPSGNDIGEAFFKITEDGKLIANDFNGDREAIRIDSSYKGKGIAKELYRQAVLETGKPIENINSLTEDGKKFREALRSIAPNIFYQKKKLRPISKVDSIKKELTESLGKDLNIDVYDGEYTRDFETENGFDDVVITDKATEKRAAKMGMDTAYSWFHGTKGDLTEFSNDTLGSSTGAGSAKLAHFFASDPETASDYASASDSRLQLRSNLNEAVANKKESEFKNKMKDKYGSKWISKLSEKEKTERKEIKALMDKAIEDFKLSQYSEKHIDYLKDDIKRLESSIEQVKKDIKNKQWDKTNKITQESVDYYKSLIASNIEWILEDGKRYYNLKNKDTGELLVNRSFKDKEDSKNKFYDTPEIAKEAVTRLENRIKDNTKEKYENYLKEAKSELSDKKELVRKTSEGINGEQVYRVVLGMKNPLIVDFKGAEYREVTYREILEKAKEHGYDGVFFKNTYDPAFLNTGKEEKIMDVAAVFDPKQIRSVNAKFLEQNSANLLAQENKGSITFGNDRQFNINLFKGKDESTFLHETGHLFLEVMGDLSTAENADAKVKEDYSTLLKWLGVWSRDQITTEHHEKFARGFEAYLYEGKAPNEKLKNIFRAFSTWLKTVYKKITELNVDVSPEVKGVFDRMLAADEQIENMDIKQMFSDPFTFMNEADALEYLNVLEYARLDARDKLQAKLMKDITTKQDSAYKKRYNEIQKQEQDTADKMVEFKTIDAIQGELKLSKPLIDRDYEVFKNSLPYRSTIVDGGQNPDVVASIFGYENGQAMLQAIAPFKRGKSEYVDMMTATRMKAEYPELLTSPELSNEALNAAYNDNYQKLKRMELDYLFKNDPKIIKQVGSTLIKRMPSDKEVKKQAVKIIATTKVKDLKPHLYRNAEKRFAAEAAKYFKSGEFDLAFNAKKKEYLNFELFRVATDAQDDVKKSVKDFKKLFKSDEDMAKSRDTDVVNAAKAILADYGIMRSEKTAEEYLGKMKAYDQQTYSVLSNIVAEVTKDKDVYQNVNYDVFVNMRDTVMNLFDLAKDRKEIEIDGIKQNIDKVTEDLSLHLQTLDTGAKKIYKETVDKWGLVKEKLLGAKASLVRAEHWTNALDTDGKGLFTRSIFRPVSDATTKYRLAKVDVMNKYKQLLQDYGKNVTHEKIRSEELMFNFKDKSELIMALLHSGNESNLRKLLVGRGWGTANEDGSINTAQWDNFISRMQREGILTKVDYDFVQSIWNLMESLKPDAQKAHKKMLGFYFNEITASPFSVNFNGQKTEYRGGYIPAKVDVHEVEDGAIRKEREAFEENNNSFQFPTTGRGFTKSRVDAYAAPLSLDINLLGSHIDGVLRFTHIEPVVKQVAKIVTDKSFRSYLFNIDTNIAKDMLVPWLQRAATQKVQLPSDDGLGRVTDSVARYFRKTVAMQIMFGGVTNTLQQFTGMIVAMSKVKPKYIRNGLWSYVTNAKQVSNDIMEKSEWMRSTQGSNINDIHNSINEVLLNPSTFDKMKDFSQKHTYFLQSAAQNMVNTVVWSGAYEQGIEQGLTEYEAIKQADSAVRTTQGTTMPEDISRFETGTPTALLFKQFVGYFNMLGNLNASEITKISRTMGLKKGAGKAFYIYLTAFMLPAVLSDIIVKAMSGKFDEDDDDSYVDDLITSFFGSQFKTFAAAVPYGGQLAVAAYNKTFTKNVSDDRLSLSPVLSILETTVGAPTSLYKDIVDKGELSKKTTKDVLQFMGIMSGLPLGPAGKPIGYLMDVESGKANPTGPVDFTRGLVTGKTGK